MAEEPTDPLLESSVGKDSDGSGPSDGIDAVVTSFWSSVTGSLGVALDTVRREVGNGMLGERGQDTVEMGTGLRAVDSRSWWTDLDGMVKGISETLDGAVRVEAIEGEAERWRERGVAMLEQASSAVRGLDVRKAGEDVAREIERGARGLFEDGSGEDLESTPEGFRKDPMAPWDHMSLEEQPYADTLREEMLRLVVDGIYSKKRREDLFLAKAAEKEGFTFNFARDGFLAKGALLVDANLKRLRSGLVPRYLKESEFWDNYFFHLQRIRNELVTNHGIIKRSAEDEQASEEAAAAAAVMEQKMAVVDSEKTLKTRNWDEEIDKIFDDDDD